MVSRKHLAAFSFALTLGVAAFASGTEKEGGKDKSKYDYEIKFDFVKLVVNEEGDLKPNYPKVKRQVEKAIEFSAYFNLNDAAELQTYATVVTRLLDMAPGQSISVEIKGDRTFQGKIEVAEAVQRGAPKKIVKVKKSVKAAQLKKQVGESSSVEEHACVVTGGKSADDDAKQPGANECVVGDLMLKKLPKKNEYGFDQYILKLADESKTSWTLGAVVSKSGRAVLVETYNE